MLHKHSRSFKCSDYEQTQTHSLPEIKSTKWLPTHQV